MTDSSGSEYPMLDERPWWASRILWVAVGLFFALTLIAALILNPGLALPGIALTFGLFFFIFAVKYFASITLILLATARGPNGNGNGNRNGYDKVMRALFNLGNGNGHAKNGGRNGLKKRNGNGNGGLTNGYGGKLPPEKQPFVSIQLPMFNETRVVDRLLDACTKLDYENYEILVADDSSDETVAHLERWAKHPRVRVSHRINRSGFKGAALKHATEVMSPDTKFVVIFDADFIPPPDVLHQFLSYFYGINGNNGNGEPSKGNGGELTLADESLAVVQGYQWHVLNASENWITKGIRSEFAGSYVVERSAQELTGGMKMISGSVFMIRADVLREHVWGTSITEDWELTLRLYLSGYRVLYSPFIQAPAECVSDFKQLTRQRMRWAEGHTFNVKKFFVPILSTPHLTHREKLEFLYYAPYYLTSVLFLVGTVAWMTSEWIFNYSLPFWSAALGWSLVFTNTFALIFMNMVGLFQERSVRRNWTGLLSFTLLTFLLVPYQAYASVKGLIEPHEGGWNRTRKSGVITDVVKRIGMGKRMPRLLPKKKQKRSIDLDRRLGSTGAKIVERLPKVLRRRAGQGMRPAPGIALGALLVVVQITGVSGLKPRLGEPENVHYFQRMESSSGYSTSFATPAGESVARSESIAYFTALRTSPTNVPAGNSEVHLWVVTAPDTGTQLLKLGLNAGSDSTGWTSLGSTIWALDTVGEPQFLSATFYTEQSELQPGERLRLDVVLPPGGNTTIAWGGADGLSRLETPTDKVPIWTLTLLPAVPLLLYGASWIRRRGRVAMRLLSFLIAMCTTLALLAVKVPSAGASPAYDVNTGSTFWWYDDTSPLQYMMYQSQPSGSNTSAGNTAVSFCSDTWPDTWQLNAGTTTVYFYVETTGQKKINFTLRAGSGSTFTTLGTVEWQGNISSIQLVSISFSTSSYTFSTGERLCLDADIANNATIYWDGSYNNSRTVVPSIVVSELGIALVVLVVGVPVLAARTRKIRRARS